VTAPASAAPQRRTLSARLKSFGAACWEFVIGDDWVAAAGVVIGLLGTWGLHTAGAAAWWLLPLLLVVLLPVSLERAVSGSLLPRRRRGPRRPPASPHTPPDS
jgi:hypothetical protein